MKLRLAIWLTVFSLALSVMSIARTTEVHADDGEKQPAQEQPVISSEFEKYLSSLSPTDNISVLVYLKRDPSLDQKIQAIWQGQPDDEQHILTEQLMQKIREDPGYTDEAIVKRLNEINTSKSRQIDVLHEQAYAEGLRQAKQRIEQLPDTVVTSTIILLNNLGVDTKVSNIEAIAAVPDVALIAENARGEIPPMYYLGLLLLSPNNGSLGNPANRPSFSWLPYNETTKYEIILAKDPGLTQIIKQAQTTTTAYEYDGTLDYNTNYFWQVKSIDPPSDPSATFSFRTEAAPPPEVQSKSSPLSWELIVIMVIAMAASAGLVTWLTISRRKKIK
jgi:hypothetical protein